MYAIHAYSVFEHNLIVNFIEIVEYLIYNKKIVKKVLVIFL